jgi:predicted alpha/beta hydrolase
VPAHAVEYEHHRRVVGHDYGGTVLIVLPVTESGNFCVFDVHTGLRLECPVARNY